MKHTATLGIPPRDARRDDTLNSNEYRYINEQRIKNDFKLLDVELPHILALDSLPFHHKDPFDRLLIAQARHENLILVSNDRRFSPYPVKLLW